MKKLFRLVFCVVSVCIFMGFIACKETVVTYESSSSSQSSAPVTSSVSVTGITLEHSEKTLMVGEDYTFIATVFPSNATDKTVYWFSADESIAKVENGKITPKDEGTTQIFATTKDGGKKASCKLTVTKDGRIEMQKELIVVKGQTVKLSATVIGGTTNKISWESSDESILPVDNDGNVTAKMAGGALKYYTITAKAGTLTETCKEKTISANLSKETAMVLWGESSDVVIPEGITGIGTVFQYFPYLISIKIPSSVTSVGRNAFDGCTSLVSINVADNNAYYCSEEGILLSRDKTQLLRCPPAKTSVVIPNTVTVIGEYAFRDCSNLENVTIPGSVISIGVCAFCNCASLQSVNIPSSVTSIESSAFDGCTSLVSINVADNNAYYCLEEGILLSRDKTQFLKCPPVKTSVVIPNTVTVIGEHAFFDCSNLENVTIPSSVTSIGKYAFSHCTSLSSLTVRAIIPPSISTNSNILIVTSIRNIYVPTDSVAAYKAAEGWKDYKHIISAIQE